MFFIYNLSFYHYLRHVDMYDTERQMDRKMMGGCGGRNLTLIYHRPNTGVPLSLDG